MIASGTSGTCTWKIEDNGTLTVAPTNGSNGYFLRDFGDPPWKSYKDDITSVIFRGSIRIYTTQIMDDDKETGNASTLFGSWTGSPKLKSVYGLSSLKGLTNTNGMFAGCENLEYVDLSGVDVSGVTDMGNMFHSCESLTSLDLSSFNTSKVEDISGMFWNCTSLVSLNLSSFDTSKVKNISGMFWNCLSLTSLNLSSFNTSNIGNMKYMFQNCKSLTSLDASSFDTSKVTEMGFMFSACESLESLRVSSSFETANVTSMRSMFSDCKSLTSLDLSSFNTSKVTDMGYMFTGCKLLSSITFGNYFEISSDVDIDKGIGFGKGVNQGNGIVVLDDKAFLSLRTTERAGHWVRNVSEIYEVNAYRAEEGTADEGGSDVIINVRWSTNAQTTDRTLSVFKKLNSESTYPSSAIITKTLSGNSGTEIISLMDAGSEAYDFKVQFYDGTNTFVAFPGVPATIELVIVNKEGDFWAAGTVTAKDMTEQEIAEYMADFPQGTDKYAHLLDMMDIIMFNCGSIWPTVELYNCTGTVANNLYIRNKGDVFFLNGRIAITNFARKGSNPGVQFKLNDKKPTKEIVHYSGIRAESPREVCFFNWYTDGYVRLRTSESYTNATGTTLTLIVSPLFVCVE